MHKIYISVGVNKFKSEKFNKFLFLCVCVCITLFLIEIHTLLTMLTNITDNTNINLVATSTTCNIHAVICTTYNTSYFRHLQ